MSSINAGYHFECVSKNSPNFQIVADQFSNVIAPIYGNQSEALAKIAAATDRVCEVLIEDISSRVAGILVYKSEPTNEFAIYGAIEALELKTLFVVDAASQSGKGLGTRLIDRIKTVAADQKFQSIVVTVSEEKIESQKFFSAKEFKVANELVGKYKQDVVETVFVFKKELY